MIEDDVEELRMLIEILEGIKSNFGNHGFEEFVKRDSYWYGFFDLVIERLRDYQTLMGGA